MRQGDVGGRVSALYPRRSIMLSNSKGEGGAIVKQAIASRVLILTVTTEAISQPLLLVTARYVRVAGYGISPEFMIHITLAY